MLLDTPICDFGWQAPDFTLQDPDGQRVAIRAQIGANGLLIAFICNHCPYVKAIAQRLAADAQTLIDEGFGVLAVMSNDHHSYPADSPENMRLFATANKFPFSYLVDEDQSVGRAYGAVCTPDFFGFDRTGGLQYRGRLDDQGMQSPGAARADRRPELLDAMRLIATTGRGPEQQKPSMGCSIKWRRN